MKKIDLHNKIKPGFKVPEDYFETFEDNFLNEIKLKNAVNDSGFELPEGYFETFDEALLKNIKAEIKPTKVIRFSRKKIIYYLSGVAAALLLLITLIPGFSNKDNNDVSVELVQTYFDNSEMNAYELGELLLESEFLEEDFSIIETNFEEDQLEDYLLENSDIENMILQ